MDTTSQTDEQRIMEGWLYQIHSNKFGFQYSRKRYYVLHNRHLRSFSSVSNSLHKDPVRFAVLNSCICVIDIGRKRIRGKLFFIFTVCGIACNAGCVKLGARNHEDAAKWVDAFKKVSLKMNQHPGGNMVNSRYDKQHSRLKMDDGVHDSNSFDIHSRLASITDRKTADVSSSYWTIFGCHNGIRLFKEARNHEGQKRKASHPAIAAMSVIDGAPEIVFQILMSLGSSRSEWDFCFQNGTLVETIDAQTDIIHKLLKNDWLPWGVKRRDLLLQRYWSKEDDGTYLILYKSIHHKKCPPQKNYVRACIKSGGYVISPVDRCKQSVVIHMLNVDWKLWRNYSKQYSDKFVSIQMTGRLAALREFFKTNIDDCLSDFSLQESEKKDLLHQSQTSTGTASQITENEESDEFFETSETFVDDQLESSCAADSHPEINSQDNEPQAKFADDSKENLHEYTVAEHGKHYATSDLCYYIFSLQEDQTGNLPNSWSVPEPSLFQIRGETYFKDRKKITAKSTLMQTVSVDLLRSDKREDDLAGRSGNIVQVVKVGGSDGSMGRKFAADGRPEFFFVINFQIPGSTTYNIASYYMTSTPIKDLPLLDKFVKEDDAFRNSRFKLISHITKGPWIFKKTASRAALVGRLLNINYIHGKNYIELDIDVGSFALARGLAGTALSCFSSLIAETAFVIQANTADELPEQLCGASRVTHLDVSKALVLNHPD